MSPSTVQQAYEKAFAHFRQGRLADAETLFREILAADPNHHGALHLLGILAHQAGHGEDAVLLIGRAAAFSPLNADYHCNLGIALAQMGEFDRAIDELRVAIRLNPDGVQAHNNLANLLRRRGRIDEAIEEYRRALRLDPDYSWALSNLGNALADAGQLDEAIASFRRAEAVGNSVAGASLLHALHFHPQSTSKSLSVEHVRWNEKYGRPLAPRAIEHPNNRDPDRPLRIGYVSPDLRLHPVGRFLAPLLEHHDRTNVEIFCYSDVHRPDEITARFRKYAHIWRETVAMSDEQLAELIRQDQIDILVDLTMHMAGTRLGVFARKAAPVQVTYLAYCGTTGLETIDYRLTDPYLDPPGRDEGVYSEKSVRLPHSYWCYEPPPDSPRVGPSPAGLSNCVTFGCLNNFCKVTDRTLGAWRRILCQVADSRLIVHAHEGSHRSRVLDYFAAGGVDPSRIEFQASLPLVDYLKSYDRIDIALDPFPYSGGTTTCDAIWMGVPVVALAGETAVSRSGLSILSNIGCPEWVGNDPADYARIAITLAGDHARLAGLRRSLRAKMRSSPLMNAPQFARDIESVFRQMWKEWARGG